MSDDDTARDTDDTGTVAAASAPHADLHVHTTISDGQLTLPDLPAAACAGDVEVVAVTDHDRVHPGLPAPVQVVAGSDDAPAAGADGVADDGAADRLVIVRGIELRVETDRERVDLLGYGVEHTEALDAELERIQRDRVERGGRIIENVEDRQGVDLDLEPRPGLGRPHIARAIADSEADYDYEGAFDELIGNDGPCFVARDVTGVEAGVELLREACAVVGLAHPLRYDDPAGALELARDLDAVEVYYPYARPMDPEDPTSATTVGPAAVERVADEADLLPLGGSDAHDRDLGRAGPPAAVWHRLAERLPEPAPVRVAGEEFVRDG